MINYLKRLSAYQVYTPGLERKVLNELPELIVSVSLVLALPSLFARVFLSTEMQKMADILVIGLEIFFLGMAMTLAISAFIVMLSRGSESISDPHPLAK